MPTVSCVYGDQNYVFRHLLLDLYMIHTLTTPTPHLHVRPTL